MIVHDPLRNALRGLVSAKLIFGWSPPAPGRDTWSVSLENGPSTSYTAQELNDYIGRLWEDA